MNILHENRGRLRKRNLPKVATVRGPWRNQTRNGHGPFDKMKQQFLLIDTIIKEAIMRNKRYQPAATKYRTQYRLNLHIKKFHRCVWNRTKHNRFYIFNQLTNPLGESRQLSGKWYYPSRRRNGDELPYREATEELAVEKVISSNIWNCFVSADTCESHWENTWYPQKVYRVRRSLEPQLKVLNWTMSNFPGSAWNMCKHGDHAGTLHLSKMSKHVASG